MHVRFSVSLRNVEDLLLERGIDICYETVRLWWNRFGLMYASEIHSRRVAHRNHSHWHLDEMVVKINGKRHWLWRAVHHKGEILENCVTRKHDRNAALKFLKKALKRDGFADRIVTDGLRSYPAAMRKLGNLNAAR